MIDNDLRSAEESTTYPLTRAEMALAKFDPERPNAETAAIAEMVRTRGAAYNARFRHTAELSWRMPDFFTAAVADGRVSIDHMDAIWRRMERHSELREQLERELDEQRADREESTHPSGWVDDFNTVPDGAQLEGNVDHAADAAVDAALTKWLSEQPHRLHRASGFGVASFSTVSIHRFREVVDQTLDFYVESRRA